MKRQAVFSVLWIVVIAGIALLVFGAS